MGSQAGPLLSPPQTETDTGTGNSICIVLPRFRERKCLNSLLCTAAWGHRQDNTELGECLSWQSACQWVWGSKLQEEPCSDRPWWVASRWKSPGPLWHSGFPSHLSSRWKSPGPLWHSGFPSHLSSSSSLPLGVWFSLISRFWFFFK